MNISERISTRFWIVGSPVSAVESREQMLAQVLNNPPLLFYDISASAPSRVTPLGKGNEFPESAHLLSLELRLDTSNAALRSSSPSTASSAMGSKLVLRVQNIANESSHFSLTSTGMCNLFGEVAELEERSINTIWALSGKNALSRWNWTAIEREDDNIDLNLMNRASISTTPFKSTGKHGRSKYSSNVTGNKQFSNKQVLTQCSGFNFDLKKHDLRTYYVSL